jgi:hypothetical protein
VLTYLLVAVLHGNAQTNMVFYPMENQINSPGLNPAFLTSQSKYALGIFPLTGMNVGYNNQLVIKNMLLKILNGEQANDDYKEVFNSMIKLDLFYQRMENTILNVGYNSVFGSFDFRLKENMQLMTDLKGEFSEFLTNSSSQSILINNPQVFPALALHYREYSLGYAREIVKDRLSVGVRAKIYFGKFSMSSDVQGEVIKSSNDIYLQLQNQLTLSFPMNIVTDEEGLLSSVESTADFSIGKYLTNSKNIGTGFDIGLTYKITPHLMFSASVVDVGKINWKSNLNRMTFIGQYKFPAEFIVSSDGNTVTKNGGFSNETTDFNKLYKIEIDEAPYSTQLPINFYTGLKYRIDPKLSLSVVNRFITTRSMSFNSILVSGIYDIKKNLSLSSGFAILGKSYFNMPFALLYNGEAGQYYIGMDNLLSMIAPSTSDFAGITFGMCFFLFRNRNMYKEHEYLPFYKEKKSNLGSAN